MNDRNNMHLFISVVAAIVLAACSFFLRSHWDTDIVSGPLVSEGIIIERFDDAMMVRLCTMVTSNDTAEADTFLLLESYLVAKLGGIFCDESLAVNNNNGMRGIQDCKVCWLC